MLWGGKDASDFSKAVTSSSIESNGWTHILGMNECVLKLTLTDSLFNFSVFQDPRKNPRQT